MTDSGAIALRDAIILSAVNDYKNALRLQKRLIKQKDRLLSRQNPSIIDMVEVNHITNEIEFVKGRIQHIEKFFMSEWFGQLTTISPEVIIKHCREKVIGSNSIMQT